MSGSRLRRKYVTSFSPSSHSSRGYSVFEKPLLRVIQALHSKTVCTEILEEVKMMLTWGSDRVQANELVKHLNDKAKEMAALERREAYERSVE